jgi:hypothetical protein
MASSNPTIPIVFENRTGKQIFVQFLNGSFGPDQYGANGTVLLAGDHGYDIAKLSSTLPSFPTLGNIPNVALNDFTNGRIYFNFGSAGLKGLGGGYQPSPNNPPDPNYSARYAFIEPNVFGNQNNNMDLSSLDFFGMPIEASTWRDGAQVSKLTSSNGSVIINALIPTSTGTSAFVPQIAPTPPYTGFARIIGPGLVRAYHDWSDYFGFLGTSDLTMIAGLFSGLPSGSGPTAQQRYSLKARFDHSTGLVTLVGHADVVGPTTIVINYHDLNALTGIYGANPPYVVNHGTKTPGIVNDVYGWIVGDLLAGINMGFPGSRTINPLNQKPLCLCTSTEWFRAAKARPKLMFAGAQSNARYYNGYAAALAPLTSAYGFPFTDRIGGVLLYFPPSGSAGAVDYLKIVFLPD